MSRTFLNGITDPRSAALGKIQTSDASGNASWSSGASSALQPKEIAGTAYITAGNPQGWAGTDIGGWINAAWAYLMATYPNSGGQIKVGPGIFSFSTPIELGAQFYAASLSGSGASTGFATKEAGTSLVWTPSTGTAFTIGGGDSNTGNIQLDSFSLQGPAGNGATGIQISDATTGSTSFGTFKDIAVQTFGIGINWRTGGLAYGINLVNCKIQNCATGLVPTGENNVMVGGLIGSCTTGIGCSTAQDLQLFGVAFDDNATNALNVSTALARISLYGCRFENPSLTTTAQYIAISAGSLAVFGGGMQDDNTTGTATGFIQGTGGTIHLDGTWLYSGGRTYTQAFNLSSAVTAAKLDPVIAPSSVGIAQLFNIATSVFPRQGNGNPLTNVTPVALTTTTATNVDSRGGLPCPAAMRPGTRIRCTVAIQATGTGTTAHTLSVTYGTGNVSTDTAIFSSTVGGTVTAVAASGQYVVDIHFETATTAWAYLQTLITGVGALGNVNQDLGSTTPVGSAPATIATTSASFLGVYLKAGTANALTVRSVTWEILSN